MSEISLISSWRQTACFRIGSEPAIGLEQEIPQDHPAGRAFGPDAYVFGDALGRRVRLLAHDVRGALAP